MSEALPIAWVVWENFAIEGDVPRSTEFLSVTQFICEGMHVRQVLGASIWQRRMAKVHAQSICVESAMISVREQMATKSCAISRGGTSLVLERGGALCRGRWVSFVWRTERRRSIHPQPSEEIAKRLRGLD